MAVKEIVKKGHPALNKISVEVEEINEEILELIEDLKDTLYSTDNGVGLAAPQIGVNKKVIIVDLRDEIGPIILLNPKLESMFGLEDGEEGCLSLPGYYGMVERPQKIVVRAMNPEGKKIKIKASGFLARALCHEIDHLNGILFSDKARDLKKEF